jgi:hypothetical protein
MLLYNSNNKEISSIPIIWNGIKYVNPNINKGIYEANYNGETGIIVSWKIVNDIAIPDIVLPEYWITEEELKYQRMSQIKPENLIFCAKIKEKKIKKKREYYTFASLLISTKTPNKKIGKYIYGFLSYLNVEDGFSLDSDGNLVNPYSEDIEIILTNNNLVLITDEDGDEIIVKASE